MGMLTTISRASDDFSKDLWKQCRRRMPDTHAETRPLKDAAAIELKDANMAATIREDPREQVELIGAILSDNKQTGIMGWLKREGNGVGILIALVMLAGCIVGS